MDKAALINKTSLENQAADLLRLSIVNGDLAPGTRLVETVLAKEYSLSRGTIRTALHQLGSEGLITQIPYAGWSVSTLSEQDIWELQTLRSTLDAMAAKLAAQKITTAGVQELRQVFQRLLDACLSDDLKAITLLDFELHKTIVRLSTHQRLTEQYQLIENQILAYISAANRSFEHSDVGHSHRDLVEAICAGDSSAAERIAQQGEPSFNL